jgi:hypothetical protein
VTPQTPIRGMNNTEARRALGPAVVIMREAEAQLPKTMEAAMNLDEKSLRRITNDAIVTQHNVILLTEQIIQTDEDPNINLMLTN